MAKRTAETGIEATRKSPPASRAFVTRHFAKDAKAAGIEQAELCEAIEDLEKGQGDSLGGGVWKKRLDKNRYRSAFMLEASDLKEICK